MPVIQGFGGRVEIANRIYRANRWSLDWHCEDLDILTFEGTGFGSHMGGLVGADIDIDCYFHTLDNPFGGIKPLIPGTSHTVVISYIKGANNLNWTFFNVICDDMRTEADVRGVTRYTYRGKYSGGYDGASDTNLGYSGLTIVDPPSAS